MTWVLTWDYTYDSDHNVSIWDTEDNALMQACYEMMQTISDDWDMCDLDQANSAQNINSLIASRQWRAALEAFNSNEFNCDERAQYWSVTQKNMNTSPSLPGAWAPDFFTALCDDEESEEEDEEEEDEEEEPYVATSPGATCRGSHAEHNTDAYADRRDGTYLCYQCKMFQKVFGS